MRVPAGTRGSGFQTPGPHLTRTPTPLSSVSQTSLHAPNQCHRSRSAVSLLGPVNACASLSTFTSNGTGSVAPATARTLRGDQLSNTSPSSRLMLRHSSSTLVHHRQNMRSHLLATLPELFDWFRCDFGRTDNQVLSWIARVHWDMVESSRIADFISAREFVVEFEPYDWTPSMTCYDIALTPEEQQQERSLSYMHRNRELDMEPCSLLDSV